MYFSFILDVFYHVVKMSLKKFKFEGPIWSNLHSTVHSIFFVSKARKKKLVLIFENFRVVANFRCLVSYHRKWMLHTFRQNFSDWEQSWLTQGLPLEIFIVNQVLVLSFWMIVKVNEGQILFPWHMDLNWLKHPIDSFPAYSSNVEDLYILFHLVLEV